MMEHVASRLKGLGARLLRALIRLFDVYDLYSIFKPPRRNETKSLLFL